MEKDITDILVDQYIDAIKEAKDRKAEKLKELGYHPDSILTISRVMINGIEKHMINRAEIINDRMRKGLSKEEAEEDYTIFRKKVDILFDEPTRIIPMLGRAAFYDWGNERYEIHPDTYRCFVAGYGKEVEIHEKRHRKQQEKYGMAALDYLAFLEGDAELETLNTLASEKDSIKETIRDFVGLKKMADESELKKFTRHRPPDNVYIKYLLSPAIMLEMKKQGKSEEQIKWHFERAMKHRDFLQKLVEGI